jgi:hypothetical protein
MLPDTSMPVLAVCLAVCLAVLAVRWRLRQRRLERIAQRFHLTRLGRRAPPTLLERARLFRGGIHRVRLRDVMAGTDVQGRYHVARRRAAGTQHHLLAFDVSGGAALEGFHAEPVRAARGRWARLRRVLASKAPAARTSGQADLQLVWRPRSRSLLEARTLSMAVRVLHHVASVAERPRGMRLGVEIHGGAVLVHSAGAATDDALPAFVENALELRRRVLASLRKADQHDDRTAPEPNLPALQDSGANRVTPRVRPSPVSTAY